MSIKSSLASVTSSVTRSAGQLGLKVQAKSPELLLVGGVVTLIGGVVMACVASRKVDDVIDEHCEAVNDIHEHEAEEAEKILNGEDAEEQQKELKKQTGRDLTHTYFRTGLKFVKLYLPAAALIGLSLTCFLSSNNILQKRNVALSSAFTALSQEFSDYRSRVAARFGDDVEKELHYNLQSETTELHTVDENGNETVETKKEYTAMSDKPAGMYYRFFNRQTSKLYQRNHYYNQDFLEITQSTLHDLLVSRGYLFLNEVYDALGMPIVDYGQRAGWIYDPRNEKRTTRGGEDYNYVDLRIQEVYAPLDPADDPDAPRKKIWMIDPNVEGDILKYFKA